MEAKEAALPAPKTSAPMAIDGAEPQSFWMDQQGNIYYAAGFPGVEKGKAPSSPIPIKPPSAADQHQEPVRNRAASLVLFRLTTGQQRLRGQGLGQGQAEPTPISSFLQHQQSWAMANVYETPILYGAAGGTYMDEAAAAAYYAQQMAGQYPTDMVRPLPQNPGA